MQRPTTILLATTLLASTATVHFWREAQSQRQLVALLQQGALPATSQAVQRRPASGTEISKPHPVVSSNPRASDTLGTSAQACSTSPTEVWERLMPRYSAELNALMRQVTAKNYPGVAQELGLTGMETTTLLDLLQKHQAVRNFIPASYASGDAAILKEIERANAEIPGLQNAELAALLGPEKYSKWQAYQPRLEAHRELNQLLNNNRTSMPPLSEEQTRSLVSLIAAEKWRAFPESTASRSSATSVPLDQQERDIGIKEESNSRLLEYARSYLDAQQYNALKETMNGFVATDRKRLQARRAQMEGGVGK